jgi:Ca-activated chloride channel family protein
MKGLATAITPLPFILGTDGDFNVGVTNLDDLKALIEAKRQSGVFFSALGFGTGNYNDHLMEELTNLGNGTAYYIDQFSEARKVFAEDLTGTLQTIAKDVKIQVEFNPDWVAEYRLIGYDNRSGNRRERRG